MSVSPELLDRLALLFGERFSTAMDLREQHGQGESYHPVAAPDVVVFARTTEEVAAAVKLCAAYGAPIIPFGAGTSLEGHLAALAGGVSIDLSQMTAIIEANVEDMDATVEAGVTRSQLNSYLRDTGLFFPVDPGADATFGGMAATRASGTSTVRYGTMRENILALEVVLPDGRIIRTASRAAKSAAGYDLTRLFIGSEGTLGIITKVTVRLRGIPEAVTSAVCSFPSVAAAVDTVTTTLQAGLPLARVELLDEGFMGAVVHNAGLPYRVAPTLFFELHGSPALVELEARQLQDLVQEQGGMDFRWTADATEGNALWEARHKAYYALLMKSPGLKALNMDTCVPRSRLSECILAAQADLAKSSLKGAIIGHVGDGNFHVSVLFDPTDPAQLDEALAISKVITHRAIAAGGTCTGEHGIGYGKIGYLAEELGEAVDVMRLVKGAIDPKGLMNPGKIMAS